MIAQKRQHNISRSIREPIAIDFTVGMRPELEKGKELRSHGRDGTSLHYAVRISPYETLNVLVNNGSSVYACMLEPKRFLHNLRSCRTKQICVLVVESKHKINIRRQCLLLRTNGFHQLID